MASGEYEFQGAVAYAVGEVEHGFAQMAEMINVSRLSNGMRAAAMMRRSLLEAVVHARGRSAFGKVLIDLPLLREQLFEMALDVEAALSIVLYAARALDEADAGSEFHERIVRITTPLIKYANCRRARTTSAMAMNVRGGNGYIEEWVNAKLVRDSLLGSIWEGAENVVALDVARAASRERAHEALFRDLEARIEGLLDVHVVREAGPLADALQDTRRRFERLLAAGTTEREAKMAHMCDRLASLVCCVLLFGEADAQGRAGAGYRKLLVAAEYRRRNLDRQDPLDGSTAGVQWLDAVIDWGEVPAEAVAPHG